MTSAVAPVATTGEQSPVSAPRERTGRRAYRWGIGIGLIGLAIALPYLPIQIPIVFNGPINSPGRCTCCH